MSNEVKRYSVRGQFDHGLNLMTTREVVLASDYDALAAELAAIRAAGGEQVEVVAYQCGESGRLFSANFSLSKPEPLMRISQHGRIVAAMAAELATWKHMHAEAQELYADAMIAIGKALGIDVSDEPRCKHVAAEAASLRAELEAARKQEPVAWMLSDAVGGSCLEFQKSDLHELQQRYGGEIVPVYSLPPLAGQLSVPRELLERLLNALDKGFPCIRVAEELRALLATPSMEVK